MAGDAVRLQLAELTEAAAAELVAALVGGRPDDKLLLLAGTESAHARCVTWSPWPEYPHRYHHPGSLRREPGQVQLTTGRGRNRRTLTATVQRPAA